ncbi:MAG: putative quinol monooxygenase [Bacteroidota bacterium]
MINRIVRMSFEPDKVNEFVDLFNASKHKIAAFPGCTSLKLLRDANEEQVFFTYSTWESQEHLDAYRKSDLFKQVWSRTRALFNSKPMAWSTLVTDNVK